MDLAILVNQDRSLSSRQSHHIPYQHTPRSSQDYDIVGSAKMVLRENVYGYKPSSQKSQTNTPQTPPTPPVEEPRCILPSISNLIARAEGQPATTHDRIHPTSLPPSGKLAEIATGGRTSQPQHSPSAHQAYLPRHEQHRPNGLPGRIESPRADLPPTPPLRQDAHFDGSRESRPHEHGTIHSVPSVTPLGSISALNNTDEHAQRQPLSPHLSNRHPLPSSHQSSPAGNWSAYYGSPNSVVQTPGGLYSQRPLPQTFPPSMSPINIISAAPVSGPSETVNQWQHHHYISPSSQASFPPNQDRYSCATCNKAFSRPSSLRIHSHSHTGEKPYKCPHRGCGKAFSVRSNMKRHERGCHPSSPPS